MSAPHPPLPEPDHTQPLTTSSTSRTETTVATPTATDGSDQTEGTERMEGAEQPAGTWLEAGRHPVNVGHLVMGVAFLGLTLVWALLVSGAVEAVDARWLLPLPWLAAGGAGMAATVVAARRHR
ncbi:hypothetical protein INN71_08275 [Nocardioides sp. ChNu-153]|uniref:hypothetical protein n=1 Tax=unclassified Nocardioides TaxID=2615069 RepID=UPI00240702A2|nr:MULTISPECIES: hypothetical protein [unclassified Nocardioides]MDF9716967.1 hypothetical protein [Nocardioides sp. ChNu-99]MDN7121386.1 hypothetical protein [Nocardioides sp. ChNu-153]